MNKITVFLISTFDDPYQMIVESIINSPNIKLLEKTDRFLSTEKILIKNKPDVIILSIPELNTVYTKDIEQHIQNFSIPILLITPITSKLIQYLELDIIEHISPPQDMSDKLSTIYFKKNLQNQIISTYTKYLHNHSTFDNNKNYVNHLEKLLSTISSTFYTQNLVQKKDLNKVGVLISECLNTINSKFVELIDFMELKNILLSTLYQNASKSKALSTNNEFEQFVEDQVEKVLDHMKFIESTVNEVTRLLQADDMIAQIISHCLNNTKITSDYLSKLEGYAFKLNNSESFSLEERINLVCKLQTETKQFSNHNWQSPINQDNLDPGQVDFF